MPKKIKVAKDLIKALKKARIKADTEIRSGRPRPISRMFSNRPGSEISATRMDPVAMAPNRIAKDIGTRGEKVTVGKRSVAAEQGIRANRTKASMKRAERIAKLETKLEKGTITSKERKELERLVREEAKRAEDATRRAAIAGSQTKRTQAVERQPAVDYETGEIVNEAAFNKMTPMQMQALERNAAARQQAGNIDPRAMLQREAMERRYAAAPRKKGGKVTTVKAKKKCSKPRGVGCATRGYGKAMKGKK